jgi:hypothetical protein
MILQSANSKPLLKARVKEFSIPPISDGLVLGKDSPIGCVAIRRSLELLMVTPFEHIEVGDADDVVGDILVRQSLLRRISRERLVEFVLHRIKPMMGPEEILHLELTVEVLIEDGLL